MITGQITTSLSNFSLHLSAGTALNKGTGGMDDYDWLNSSSKIWTNWSNSTIFLDRSFILDTSLTYSLTPVQHVSIPLGIGYKLNYLNWSDKTGDHIYKWGVDANNNYYQLPTEDTGNWGGIPGLNYTIAQNIIFLQAGLSYTAETFGFELNTAYAPYISAWDLDHHLINKQDGTGTFYLDSFTSHLWYRVNASASYIFKNRGKLSLAASFEELAEVIGSVNIYNEDPSDPTKIGSPAGYFSGGAGLASKLLSISFGYTYQF